MSPQHRSAGFTLVEVLIALVLLSMLMLVLTSALRSMGQVEERVERRIEQADDFRLASQLLADTLGRVSARRFAQESADGPAQAPFFEAGNASLAWIGVMPARFGLGGRHYLRLGLEPIADGTSALVLRHTPWTGEPSFNNWAQAQALVLAAPVSTLALGYQEPISGQWADVWPPPGMPFGELPPNLLPVAVSVQISGPAPEWPPLMLSIGATGAADSRWGSGGGFGGGGRQ